MQLHHKGSGMIGSIIMLLVIVIIVVVIINSLESETPGAESGGESGTTFAPIEGAQGARDAINERTVDFEKEF